MQWGPSKVIIHHQKVIISPQKCALIPQNRSFNHLFLTFSLTKIICALLLKNFASRIYSLFLAKFSKMSGWGGGGSNQFWQCQDFGTIWILNPHALPKFDLHNHLQRLEDVKWRWKATGRQQRWWNEGSSYCRWDKRHHDLDSRTPKVLVNDIIICINAIAIAWWEYWVKASHFHLHWPRPGMISWWLQWRPWTTPRSTTMLLKSSSPCWPRKSILTWNTTVKIHHTYSRWPACKSRHIWLASYYRCGASSPAYAGCFWQSTEQDYWRRHRVNRRNGRNCS